MMVIRCPRQIIFSMLLILLGKFFIKKAEDGFSASDIFRIMLKFNPVSGTRKIDFEDFTDRGCRTIGHHNDPVT